MDLYVRDTVLYTGKEIDRSIPHSQCAHIITKRKLVMRPNGEVTVRKVTVEEMERLWE